MFLLWCEQQVNAFIWELLLQKKVGVWFIFQFAFYIGGGLKC